MYKVRDYGDHLCLMLQNDIVHTFLLTITNQYFKHKINVKTNDNKVEMVKF